MRVHSHTSAVGYFCYIYFRKYWDQMQLYELIYYLKQQWMWPEYDAKVWFDCDAVCKCLCALVTVFGKGACDQ